MGKRKVFSSADLLILAAFTLIVAINGSAQSSQNGTLPPIKTVFIILEENYNWSEITPALAPYIRNTLVPLAAHAEQYYNPPGLHPSEPNYLWLEAGSNLGITNDADPSLNHQNTVDHLVAYLNKAGISWKAYAEDIDGTTCPLTGVNNYAPRHNPFVFFDDVTNGNNSNSAYCISHIRPYAELATDLENNTVAQYNFIEPNLDNDMHDGTIPMADTWLSREVPKILASKAYQEGGALFIMWDEGDDGTDGPIGMIVLSPFAKPNYSNNVRYTHSSTLKTLQEIFGVTPLLRDAANATDLSDLFLPGVQGPISPSISVSDGGIVNNAGYNQASPSIAPGELVAIFGMNLTDGTFCLSPSCFPSLGSDGRLNTTMSGTQVMINGIPAPILYTSPSQIGVQIPFELTGALASVQVSVGEQASLPKVVSVSAVSPGIFTLTSDGKGAGAIQHMDGSPVTVQSPAHAGELVVLYANGLGQVTPSVPTGAVSTSVSVTIAPTTVNIDSVAVIPDFAGVAGCCVGLNQVNFRIPASTRSGPDIPVTLSIAGVLSNTVTIAVQ